MRLRCIQGVKICSTSQHRSHSLKQGAGGPDQCKGRRNTSLQMVEMIFFRGGCPSSVLRPRCRCYARIYQSSQSHSGPYKGRNEPFLPYCRRQSRNDFVPEGDVYRLVAHSGLPPVECFEWWGFGDVLERPAYMPCSRSMLTK